jgi:uncharacterized protein
MTQSYWAIYSWDSPDAPTLRKEHLKAHLDYAASIMSKIAVGGPLRAGNEPDFGSLIVLKVDGEAEARAILEADPYFQSGVWERFEIRPFRPVIGEWVGGRNW